MAPSTFERCDKRAEVDAELGRIHPHADDALGLSGTPQLGQRIDELGARSRPAGVVHVGNQSAADAGLRLGGRDPS